MLRPYHTHSRSLPYGMHRFHCMQPSVIRYARSSMSGQPIGMDHSESKALPVSPPKDGLINTILDILAAIWCIKEPRPTIQPIRQPFTQPPRLTTRPPTSRAGGGITTIKPETQTAAAAAAAAASACGG